MYPHHTSCTEAKIILIIGAFLTVGASTVYGHFFHAAGKLCENELKVCAASVTCSGTFNFFLTSAQWWWRGVAVTSLGVSTMLLYVGPG